MLNTEIRSTEKLKLILLGIPSKFKFQQEAKKIQSVFIFLNLGFFCLLGWLDKIASCQKEKDLFATFPWYCPKGLFAHFHFSLAAGTQDSSYIPRTFSKSRDRVKPLY